MIQEQEKNIQLQLGSFPTLFGSVFFAAAFFFGGAFGLDSLSFFEGLPVFGGTITSLGDEVGVWLFCFTGFLVLAGGGCSKLQGIVL